MRVFYTPIIRGEIKDELARELEPISTHEAYKTAEDAFGKDYTSEQLDGKGWIKFQYQNGIITYQQDS